MQGYNFIFIPDFALRFCFYSCFYLTSFFLFLVWCYTLFFIPVFGLHVCAYSCFWLTRYGELFHEFMNQPTMIYHHFFHAIRFSPDIFFEKMSGRIETDGVDKMVYHGCL
jgi:hypothetical protein